MSVRIAGGRFAGRLLAGPPRPGRRRGVASADGIRPTAARLRKSLFTVLADEMVGACVLDVCAGVGTLGFEAISRGARECVFVERAQRMARLVERNADRLTVSAFELAIGDAVRELRRLRHAGRGFDVAFLDPPWESWEAGAGLELLAEAVGLAPLVVAEHRSSWLPPLRVVAGADDESNPAARPPAALKTRTTTAGDGAFSLYRREGVAEERRTNS